MLSHNYVYLVATEQQNNVCNNLKQANCDITSLSSYSIDIIMSEISCNNVKQPVTRLFKLISDIIMSILQEESDVTHMHVPVGLL